MKLFAFAVALVVVAPIAACAGSDSGSELKPSGLAGTGGKLGGAGSGGSSTTTGGSAGASSGAGGAAIGGAAGSVGQGGASPALSADDISYDSKSALAMGPSILFNDWNSTPNRVMSMAPDGSATTEVFSAFRIWSMGVSNKVDRIAFASGDPQQEPHYGVTIGDAIQNTWMYDVSKMSIQLMAPGNVNDECHAFSADDKYLYVCRRAGFSQTGNSPPYALARIDTTTGVAEQITEPSPTELALHPQPLPDGAALLFTHIAISGGTQTRSIRKLDLATKQATTVRADAGSAQLSPDGTKYVFVDYKKTGLWVAAVGGADAVQVSTDAGTSARFSPDATKIVYLSDDKANNCSSVKVVAADGSTKGAATMIRDCAKTKEFITELAWVVR